MPVYCSDIFGTSEALVRVRELRDAYKYDKCNTRENRGGHKSRRHDTASSGGGSWWPPLRQHWKAGPLWVILLINSIQRILMCYDYLALSLSHHANHCGVTLMGVSFSPPRYLWHTSSLSSHLILLVIESSKPLNLLKPPMFKSSCNW